MHTLLALLLFVVVLVVPNQVIAEDSVNESEEKRQVSVLARDGHLPYYAGKRFIDSEDTEYETLKNDWDPNEEPSVLLLHKRYVGALAKTGDLVRFKQNNDKRDDVDTLIDELLTAEELRRIRLEALREELLKQGEELESEDLDAEKRSLASLARTGGFPFNDDKRSIASMARLGYLRDPNFASGTMFDKRGISSLARNGDFPYFGKRGGVSSVMRNGFSYQKRNVDSDLDSLLTDDYDLDYKRNVASLARGYNLPFMSKRNIAAFARNGWLHGFPPSSKKSAYYYWDDSTDESKRNLPSLLRNRLSKFSEGKRFIGDFFASNGFPKAVKTWNNQGKRDLNDDDSELTKRYVSSLLKQGPLPVSSDNVETNSEDNQSFAVDEQSKVESTENMSEEKRHIGSYLASKSFVMRKKKSITSEDQFGEQPPTISSVTKPRTDENKMKNDIQKNHRQKREAIVELAAASDEYPMPVMQNTEILSDYEEGDPRKVFDEATRKKRYFGALARSGWLPYNHYYKGAVSKRHIGALARLGWLSTFRNIRGYNRIGRTVRSNCKRSSPSLSSEGWRKDPGWKVAARGEIPLQQPELWKAPRRSLDSYYHYGADKEVDNDEDEDTDPVKRYLLIPTLGNILLRRQSINWTH